MKVLIVGSNKKWAIEIVYKKHLEDLGVNIELFNAHGEFLDYYTKGIVNKLMFRFGISRILNRINQKLLKKLDDQKYDIVWVFKGMEIFPETVKKIQEMGIITVNYNADHPFLHFSKGTGNKFVTESIPYFHHHFSYSKQVIARFEKDYNLSSSWLPFGYHLSSPPISIEKVIKKVCFIGNPDENRVSVIKILVSNSIEVDVYGHGWEKFFSDQTNLKIFGPVYGEDFVQVAQKYLIQLNVFRPHNLGSHNMRTFEMPALGCIMLAPDSEEHRELFVEGQEAFYYRDSEDLIETCLQIFSKSNEELNRIRWNAYQRSFDSGYSYENRVTEVLNLFKKLIG